jgi:hypothetical protein
MNLNYESCGPTRHPSVTLRDMIVTCASAYFCCSADVGTESGRRTSRNTNCATGVWVRTTEGSTLMLATNLCPEQLPAELIWLLYRKPWQIELCSRWIKCILKILFSTSPTPFNSSLPIHPQSILGANFSVKACGRTNSHDLFFHLTQNIGADMTSIICSAENRLWLRTCMNEDQKNKPPPADAVYHLSPLSQNQLPRDLRYEQIPSLGLNTTTALRLALQRIGQGYRVPRNTPLLPRCRRVYHHCGSRGTFSDGIREAHLPCGGRKLFGQRRNLVLE